MPNTRKTGPAGGPDTNSDPHRIAIVQLSDIHIAATNDPVIPRGERIVAAIRPLLQEVQGLVFALTGDVAYSGCDEEYEIAFTFLSGLKDSIRKIPQIC